MNIATADIQLHQRNSVSNAEGDVEQDTINVGVPENAPPALLPASRRRQFSILMCSSFDVFLTMGLNQAYGVFLAYYLDPANNACEHFLPPHQLKNKTIVAFVGTIGAGLTWGGSIFVNP